ncbi:alpha-L-rhamnosidase [Cohnella hashimotonis]|uniref:alpha-L-rhamnosidase n=1 Tax=Cohnella hashimotonis TaxID=2826895 RepID=A0ABT6TNK7_9BACL|nr:alpha-L-rhamnosidase [Cohnella hashimotonis]MDI4648441.1 family 78 glycoside hydrolase catalytic domain [Cohnella hashimotonis]
MDSLQIYGLTAEYRTRLLGTDVRRPRISWKLRSERKGTLQEAYRIQVAKGQADFESPLWDSGRIESDESVLIPYDGPEAQSRTRYYYRVKAWDTFGRESEWSETEWWETALLSVDEWQVQWITPDSRAIEPAAEPAFLLRKPFDLNEGDIVSARIYATAAGVYKLYLNGSKVGDDELAPGWTSYNSRLQYQTYDVTALLREGGNALGATVANGWYKGRLGWENKSNHYGDRRAVLVQLHVRYRDGAEVVIASDESWKAATGPVLMSELYDGETYDARLEWKGWSEPGFDDTAWHGTERLDLGYSRLVAQENVPTRVTETLKPIAAIRTPEGDAILDMGQNMVGRIRLTVAAPAGTAIKLTHAEVLDKHGNFYMGNIRTAKQTVTYIARGEGTETYAPHFTFQGFRYVKVEGFPYQENGLPLDAFAGEVMHSDMQRTGAFECSDERVNRLQQNIIWGQRGNFLDVPTDCPQRDERLGWTGDAQVFAPTALFNYNGAAFFAKWLRDLKADQLPDGSVPFVVPNILQGYNAAAWSDAATVVPWAIYVSCGDKRILAEQYGSMKAWVDYIRGQGEREHIWDTGFHFGDWLALDAKEGSYMGATPNHMVTAAYFALSARILGDAARLLGLEEDADYYGALAKRVAAAYRDEFITPNGRVAAQTQTANVIALFFDLVDPKDRPRIARDLNEMIVDNDYHLTTGFVGTPFLCFALSDNGYHETAVKLLLQQTYPSWLYSVAKGATTIWEHWDGIKPDGSFWSDDMNSFNHYAYGAVGDWMYRKIAGLAPDPASPGYKRIRIEPDYTGGRLSHARASYESMYGMVESGWAFAGNGNGNEDEIELRAAIPANVGASILLRGADADQVSCNGAGLADAEGIVSFRQEADGVRVEAGSGVYAFTYARPHASYRTYHPGMRLGELAQWDAAKRILDRHAPGFADNLGYMEKLPLPAAANNPMGGGLSQAQFEAIVAELQTLRA